MGINGVQFENAYLKKQFRDIDKQLGIENPNGTYNYESGEFPTMDENGKLHFNDGKFVGTTKTRKQKLDQAAPYIIGGTVIAGLVVWALTKGKVKPKFFKKMGNFFNKLNPFKKKVANATTTTAANATTTGPTINRTV